MSARLVCLTNGGWGRLLTLLSYFGWRTLLVFQRVRVFLPALASRLCTPIANPPERRGPGLRRGIWGESHGGLPFRVWFLKRWIRSTLSSMLHRAVNREL